jgi:hypothetical protein
MVVASGKRIPSGLDDGADGGIKKNKSKALDDSMAVRQKDDKPVVPTIKPGERLSEFAARVNAALPLGGLINKTVRNGKDPLGLKVRRTKKERKMHKLYDEWRKQDSKIKEKREEELERAEYQEMEDDALGVKWKIDHDEGTSKRKKNRKRGGYAGETAAMEEDPWEEIKRNRGEAKIGLHDVAQAPPELKKLSKKLLTVRGAAVEIQ